MVKHACVLERASRVGSEGGERQPEPLDSEPGTRRAGAEEGGRTCFFIIPVIGAMAILDGAAARRGEDNEAVLRSPGSKRRRLGGEATTRRQTIVRSLGYCIYL